MFSDIRTQAVYFLVTCSVELAVLIPINASKVKATPLQAWRSHEVSRSLRPPDFKTIGT